MLASIISNYFHSFFLDVELKISRMLPIGNKLKMKRFTETNKWHDPWFFELSPNEKLFWLWMCDKVDAAGVIDISWKIAGYETGVSFDESIMLRFGDRIKKLANGKWHLTKFIDFQYGKLSPDCKPHKNVIRVLESHNLNLSKGYPKGINTLEEKEKEKERKEYEETIPLLPESLRKDGFEDVWKDWVGYRKKIGKVKDWSHLWKMQLKQLELWGVERAKEALTNSMLNGYQGIFEPRNSDLQPRKRPSQIIPYDR